jgi:hypothetical protein
MRAFLSALSVAVMLCAPVQANTVRKADADKFYSIAAKLRGATEDITQSERQVTANNTVFRCLDTISTEARLVSAHAAHAGTLIVLAAVMRDKLDEAYVLHDLRIVLSVVTDATAAARKPINGIMGICSDVATVNVKGQAVLNILSQMNEAVASLSDLVGKD